MTTLSIEDLQAIRTELRFAANRAREDAEALVGADVLVASQTAVPVSVRPKLRLQTQHALNRIEELRALQGRVGIVLDDMLVAADPEGINAPAAHARVHERNTKT